MIGETLTDWLLRQVAEDEGQAQEQLDAEAKWEAATRGLVGAVVPTPMCMRPERLLAECEAKRRIVALHTDNDGSCGTCTDSDYAGLVDDWPCDTLKAIALPCADRPGYLEEWRVA